MSGTGPSIVFALAGRRPDAPNAPLRFPEANVPLVRQRVRQALIDYAPKVLVASAACGADLIALEEAIALRIDCLVILPFSREQFRSTSVVDRGAHWGDIYDRVLSRVKVVENGFPDDLPADSLYLAACQAILDEAERVGSQEKLPVAAVVVWDGCPRPGVDITYQFRLSAEARGCSVIDIQTAE